MGRYLQEKQRRVGPRIRECDSEGRGVGEGLDGNEEDWTVWEN